MFVNLSNHPSDQWPKKQREAAAQWGEIRDYPFPAVPAEADEEYVRNMADRIAAQIVELRPDAVMCQGEFTLTYAIIHRLKEEHIPVVAACSSRIVHETLKDGHYKKTAEFEFVRFRAF